MQQYVPTEYWTERFRRYGHTGDSDSTIYRYDQPQRLRAIERALSAAKIALSSDTRVLDVGCGSGDVISLFVGQGVHELTGLDLSEEVIGYVQSRFAGLPINLTLQVKAVESAELPRGIFDVATSINVLQHITEEAAFWRAVENIVGAVKAGGHVLIMEFSPFCRQSTGAASHLMMRTRGEYITAFESMGCVLVGEVGLPRLGVRACRGIGRLLSGIGKAASVPEAACGDRELVAGHPSARTLRVGLQSLVKAVILGIARPFDYAWKQFPARYTDMRILVFARAQ
jgi:2-polyprenyl-3-methyl-5-hydroxy-6-metoxy-1,4-benzoquinol methylase